MNVSVFGLGYVGSVTAACLARAGHRVIGVDVNADKVAAINAGRSPVVEPGMDDLVAAVIAAKTLTATTDASAAVQQTDVALLCVGTPGYANGQPNTAAIAGVAKEISSALTGRRGTFTVLLRSTALPGTAEGTLAPVLQASAPRDLTVRVGVNPEFMREGSALNDFAHPPMVLVGSEDPDVVDLVARLHAYTDAPLVSATCRTAEAVKYASNAFHALKVCFANEVAEVCDLFGADPLEVMRIFSIDRELNLSGAYLRPGFAFGGSCLPKDVRALVWSAMDAGVQTPLLSSIVPSNQRQIRRAIDLIVATGARRIGLVGLAFKPGTDDLRDSPVVTLLEELIGQGLDVRALDRRIDPSKLVGANNRYIESAIPNLSGLLCDSVETLVAHAEVLVICTATADAARVRTQSAGRVVIDLTRGATSR